MIPDEAENPYLIRLMEVFASAMSDVPHIGSFCVKDANAPESIRQQNGLAWVNGWVTQQTGGSWSKGSRACRSVRSPSGSSLLTDVFT